MYTRCDFGFLWFKESSNLHILKKKCIPSSYNYNEFNVVDELNLTKVHSHLWLITVF